MEGDVLTCAEVVLRLQLGPATQPQCFAANESTLKGECVCLPLGFQPSKVLATTSPFETGIAALVRHTSILPLG